MSFPGGMPPPFAKYPGSPEPRENVPSLAERGVLTISVIRGNCAAGGLAVATAADVRALTFWCVHAHVPEGRFVR